VAALIRQLLQNSTDPVVRWEDQKRGEFRVLNPGLLARRIQQANPSRPISDLRCDRGVFESVPGKQLVFRFGDLEPQTPSSPPKAASPTNVILTPKLIAPASELPSKKLSVPQSRRKTYAQKISDLQKPIPGQSVNVPSPMLKRVMPKEASLSLRIPAQAAQSPSMPSLIPLTIDDMAKKEAAAAAAASSSKGLHLSGGGVSDFSGAVSDFVLPTFTPLPLSRQLSQQEIPQLDVFIPSLNASTPTEAELPLDLSNGPTKRRAGEDAIPEEEISKKPKMEEIEKETKRRSLQAEACKKYRAARKAGRQGSTEEEMEELWTFCRAALHNPEYNPKVICWESIEDGEFRIVNQEEFLNAFMEVRGTRMVRDGLKKRVKACEEAEVMHSRAHTRLGYRFGVKASDWRPSQGELVEQGRRMVPSKLAWTSSRFYHEFLKESTVVKPEPLIKKEEPMDTNDRMTFDPKKMNDAAIDSTCASPPVPLFTLTPLVQLDLPRPVQQDKATEEDGAADKDMTECDEFSCRLVLPRHRGYLAKLRLGDGITINLDRQVFAQIEEGMREALKGKEGRSRISTQDKKIANAVIRKARRKPKAKGPKKPAELETTEETLDKKEEKLPIPETNEPYTSMPVLEEETSKEDSVEKREEESGEMADVDMALERDTESPPEARHRLPLVVAPRESTPSLRRPMPPRPLLSQSPNLPTTAV
jgi:predicted transcriptional regulator